MANPTVDLRPATLDAIFYAGDGASIQLICMNSEEEDAEPINLTGEVSAQVRLNRMADDPPILSFGVDLSAPLEGKVMLTLTEAQTRELSDHESSSNGKFVGVWDVEWIPTGSEPRTLVQGKVECVVDVTR